MYWKCHGNLTKPFSFQTSLSMKKTLLGIFTILISIKLLAQEPAIYHVVYDCEAKTSVGNATLYRWSLDIGKTTAVFYDDNYRKFHEGECHPTEQHDFTDSFCRQYKQLETHSQSVCISGQRLDAERQEPAFP